MRSPSLSPLDVTLSSSLLVLTNTGLHPGAVPATSMMSDIICNMSACGLFRSHGGGHEVPSLRINQIAVHASLLLSPLVSTSSSFSICLPKHPSRLSLAQDKERDHQPFFTQIRERKSALSEHKQRHALEVANSCVQDGPILRILL